MSERKKTNLQTLRDLTETLCSSGADVQCGKCQQLFHGEGTCPLKSDVSQAKNDLQTVVDALKGALEECVALKKEISNLKKELKSFKDEQ